MQAALGTLLGLPQVAELGGLPAGALVSRLP
jgi:hypothetical protein